MRSIWWLSVLTALSASRQSWTAAFPVTQHHHHQLHQQHHHQQRPSVSKPQHTVLYQQRARQDFSKNNDESSSYLFTQVLSDVDDTIKSSGGVAVAGVALGGIDTQYKRGDVYPGVAQFMLELSQYQARDGTRTSTPPKLAILTARAEEFKVALELKESSKLAVAFREAGEAAGVRNWGIGPVLYGSVAEWIIQERKGLRKFSNFERLLEQDPTGNIFRVSHGDSCEEERDVEREDICCSSIGIDCDEMDSSCWSLYHVVPRYSHSQQCLYNSSTSMSETRVRRTRKPVRPCCGNTPTKSRLSFCTSCRKHRIRLCHLPNSSMAGPCCSFGPMSVRLPWRPSWVLWTMGVCNEWYRRLRRNWR